MSLPFEGKEVAVQDPGLPPASRGAKMVLHKSSPTISATKITAGDWRNWRNTNEIGSCFANK